MEKTVLYVDYRSCIRGLEFQCAHVLSLYHRPDESSLSVRPLRHLHELTDLISQHSGSLVLVSCPFHRCRHWGLRKCLSHVPRDNRAGRWRNWPDPGGPDTQTASRAGRAVLGQGGRHCSGCGCSASSSHLDPRLLRAILCQVQI